METTLQGLGLRLFPLQPTLLDTMGVSQHGGQLKALGMFRDYRGSWAPFFGIIVHKHLAGCGPKWSAGSLGW